LFGSLYRKITQYVVGKVQQEQDASTSGARKGSPRLQPISWTVVDAELKKQDKAIAPFENLDISVVPALHHKFTRKRYEDKAKVVPAGRQR
jgi:hypothetical protein